MMRRMTLLQWGHDLSVVESFSKSPHVGRRILGFNGATTSRSWNPSRGTATVWASRSGFNGATTSRSWNLYTVARATF